MSTLVSGEDRSRQFSYALAVYRAQPIPTFSVLDRSSADLCAFLDRSTLRWTGFPEMGGG